MVMNSFLGVAPSRTSASDGGVNGVSHSFPARRAPAWDEATTEHENSPLSETLIAVPSWTAHSLLYVLMLMVTAALLFAFFGRVDEVSTAPAVVIPVGRLKPVQSELEGIITQLLVRERSHVHCFRRLANIVFE